MSQVWPPVPHDSGWITPQLNTGWAISAGNAIQYRRFNGVVYLRGRATFNSGASGATTTIFTLPVGFRPSAPDSVFSVDASGASRLNVTSDGGVVYVGGGSVTSLSLVEAQFIADG